MKIIFDSEEQQQRWFDSVFCPSYLGLKDADKCGRRSSLISCETCWKESGLEMEVKSENDIFAEKVCCNCKYSYIDQIDWPCNCCEAFSKFEPKNKEEV